MHVATPDRKRSPSPTPEHARASNSRSSRSTAGPRPTSDVHRTRQGHVGFPHGAEQRAVVEHPADAVVDHDLPQVLVVQDIRVDEGACRDNRAEQWGKAPGSDTTGALPAPRAPTMGLKGHLPQGRTGRHGGASLSWTRHHGSMQEVTVLNGDPRNRSYCREPHSSRPQAKSLRVSPLLQGPWSGGRTWASGQSLIQPPRFSDSPREGHGGVLATTGPPFLPLQGA